MTKWADVSSAIAGALVFIIGAVVPYFVATIEHKLDKGGTEVATDITAPPPA